MREGVRGWRARIALIGFVALAVAVATVATWNDDRSRADATDDELVAEGREVYDSACASCHGKNLEGQPDWRTTLPTGGYPAPPHDASGHTWHHPDILLFEIVKFGGDSVAAAAGVKSNMPAFGDRFDDDQIWAVLAYIKSRWQPEIRERQAAITERASN